MPYGKSRNRMVQDTQSSADLANLDKIKKN